MSIQLVVFDIAGTTVKDHGEIAIAFHDALEEFGYDIPPEKIYPLMGYKKTAAIEILVKEFEPDASKITSGYIGHIHERFIALVVGYYKTTTELQALPNATKIFEWLRQRGIRAGLDTGFFNDITDVIIERTGWLKDGLVDIVVSSNQVPAGRPFPYMIQKIMKETGVNDPLQVIKIGDTEVDVKEGQNAGCLYAIGITTGAFTRETLLPHQPDFIIDNLEELIPIIEQA